MKSWSFGFCIYGSTSPSPLDPAGVLDKTFAVYLSFGKWTWRWVKGVGRV